MFHPDTIGRPHRPLGAVGAHHPLPLDGAGHHGAGHGGGFPLQLLGIVVRGRMQVQQALAHRGRQASGRVVKAPVSGDQVAHLGEPFEAGQMGLEESAEHAHVAQPAILSGRCRGTQGVKALTEAGQPRAPRLRHVLTLGRAQLHPRRREKGNVEQLPESLGRRVEHCEGHGRRRSQVAPAPLVTQRIGRA